MSAPGINGYAYDGAATAMMQGGARPLSVASWGGHKFTGKERDAESGLDDFDARFYASSLGRFMTPDWAAKPTAVPYASFSNPQSLNLYGYVNNNPTTTRDPNGHEEPTPNGADFERGADIIVGAAKGFWNGVASLANGVNAVLVNGPSIAITGHSAIPDVAESQYSNTTQAVTGTIVPLAVSTVGSIGELGNAAREGAASAEAQSITPTVQANRAVGNAFRDEVAETLKAAGRDVKTEVTKQTPFGRRVVDIEVSHEGQTLGGVETKTGNSPYNASQQSKDTYLKQQGYPVNVVRKPKEK